MNALNSDPAEAWTELGNQAPEQPDPPPTPLRARGPPARAASAVSASCTPSNRRLPSLTS